MASIKWDYSFSNLGPKKKTGGTTFYKVQIGKESRWVSMEGIRMLEKAKAAGVKFKTVRKAVTYYTEAGTRKRLKTLRGNIQRDLDDLLTGGFGGFETVGKQKGLTEMLKRAGLDDLAEDFAGLLAQMDEAQLREFYAKNKLLLSRFFADSDVYTKATSSDEAIAQANDNVRRNAVKLREKMLQILTRDMTRSEIARIEDANVRTLLMKYAREHL